jgi:hypothetical protein
MVVLMMACTTASVLTPVLAQEVTTAVNDRVEADAPVVPTVPESEQRVGGLELAAAIAAAYDNNIFLSKDDPESDTVIRVAPSVAYTQGDAKEGDGGFVRVAYRPTSVTYAQHHSENRIDHEAAVVAGWRGKVTKITYTGGGRQLGDATADTGRQTDRVEFANELRGAWIPREKITLEAAAGHRQSDYKDPTFFDSSDTYGEVAMRYAYSPKTEVGIAYQAGRFKVDDSPNQTTQQVTASIDWQPREKVRVNIEAGAEHRQTENGAEVNPVMTGRIDWTPRQGTKLYLTAYQREEASAYYAGQNYHVKGATAGVSQSLGDKWAVQIEGGLESSTYKQVAGSGASSRKDKIWFVRPAVEYKLSEDCNVALFYRASDNSSSASDFGYSQRTMGIELNYQF